MLFERASPVAQCCLLRQDPPAWSAPSGTRRRLPGALCGAHGPRLSVPSFSVPYSPSDPQFTSSPGPRMRLFFEYFSFISSIPPIPNTRARTHDARAKVVFRFPPPPPRFSGLLPLTQDGVGPSADPLGLPFLVCALGTGEFHVSSRVHVTSGFCASSPVARQETTLISGIRCLAQFFCSGFILKISRVDCGLAFPPVPHGEMHIARCAVPDHTHVTPSPSANNA